MEPEPKRELNLTFCKTNLISGHLITILCAYYKPKAK